MNSDKLITAWAECDEEEKSQRNEHTSVVHILQ